MTFYDLHVFPMVVNPGLDKHDEMPSVTVNKQTYDWEEANETRSTFDSNY